MLNVSDRKIWRRITGIVKGGGHFGIRYGNDRHQTQDESELSTVIVLIVVFPCMLTIIQLLFQQNTPGFYY
jgi:hypothetical protein